MKEDTTKPNGGSMTVEYISEERLNEISSKYNIKVGANIFEAEQIGQVLENKQATTEDTKISTIKTLVVRFKDVIKEIMTGVEIKLKGKSKSKSRAERAE